MKKEKGITLVALVVTIIVLIILAGISINLVLGDNGIITIAKKAKENTELAKTDEETQLNELYTQLEAGSLDSGNLPYDSISKLTEFKTAIANAITDMGVETSPESDTDTMVDNIKKIPLNNKLDSFVTVTDYNTSFTVSNDYNYIIIYSRYNTTITRSIGNSSDIQYLFSDDGGRAVFFVKNVKNTETFSNTMGWINYAYPVGIN